MKLQKIEKVCASIISHLRSAGNTVVDGTPGNCGVKEDLNYGTTKANNGKADFFISIHFNKFSKFYERSYRL